MTSTAAVETPRKRRAGTAVALCLTIAVGAGAAWALPVAATPRAAHARAAATRKPCSTKKKKGKSGKGKRSCKPKTTTQPKLGLFSGPTSQGTTITLHSNTGVVQLFAGLTATLPCADGSSVAWSSSSQIPNGAILSALTDNKGGFTGDTTGPMGDSLHLDGSFHGTQIKGNVEITSPANGGCDAKMTYTATYRSP